MWVRGTIFVVCAAAAVGAVLLGDGALDVWGSELFWLALNVLLVTLLLEAVLARDVHRRRKSEVEFGFQTRMALLAEELIGLVRESEKTQPPSPLWAIDGSPKAFAAGVSPSMTYVECAAAIASERYDESYGMIGAWLRELGQNYVRLFSRDQEAMLMNYRALQACAKRWRYQYELTPDAEARTRRLAEDVQREPDLGATKQELADWRAEEDAVRDDVLELLRSTGVLLHDLLRQSTGRRVALAA